MRAPGTRAKGEAGQRGHALRRSRRSQRQRAHDDAPREFDLEGVVAGRLCLGERRLGGAAEGGGIRAARRPAPPRPRGPATAWRDAAKREPRLGDRAALDPQAGGGRDDREGVGGALAHLQIARMRRECRGVGRQAHRDDQLAGFEHAFALRRVAGQTVQSLQRDLATARSCLRSPPRRRAPPAARRNRTDGWRCSPRSSRARRAGGSRRRARRSPRRARACCRRWRRRRNRRSASAAADCRRRSRHCAVAPRRPTAALRPPRESVGQTSASCARSALRTSAPMRTPPSASRSIAIEARQASDVDQTMRRVMPPFIRSSRLVPAAR